MNLLVKYLVFILIICHNIDCKNKKKKEKVMITVKHITKKFVHIIKQYKSEKVLFAK